MRCAALLGIVLVCATNAWSAPQFRLRFQAVSARWFERGGVVEIPRTPIRELELELRGRGFERVEAGRLHVEIDGEPAELKVLTASDAISIIATALPEEQFFPKDRHIVEVFVSNSGIRQKWTVVPSKTSLVTETVGAVDGLPLRVLLSPQSEIPTVWDGDQSAVAQIVGVVKPGDGLSRLVIAGVDQTVDNTLLEQRFSMSVTVTRQTPDVIIEAFDRHDRYARVLIPVYKQGRPK